MVDPTNITNYNLTDAELEERILWWCLAAGKNGRTAAKQLDRLLNILTYNNFGPFESLRFYDMSVTNAALPPLLRDCGIGCYNHKAKAIQSLIWSELNLRTCTAEDLESIYGIGMKTSRCFIIHSRPDAQYAGLDTHVLKFLRSKGVDAPLSTPGSRKKYLELEKIFLTYAQESGKVVSQFDLDIWNYYSGGKNVHGS
jgi:hypothetical protein